jgi:hypothetical protein
VPASSSKSLQHVSSENTSTGKLCALLHQIENRVFPLLADNGKAAYIYNQSAPLEVTASDLPGRAKLVHPRLDKSAFHNYPALRSVIDDGNLEHLDPCDKWYGQDTGQRATRANG